MERVGPDTAFGGSIISTFYFTGAIPADGSPANGDEIVWSDSCGIGWRFGVKYDSSTDPWTGERRVGVFMQSFVSDPFLQSLQYGVSVTILPRKASKNTDASGSTSHTHHNASTSASIVTDLRSSSITSKKKGLIKRKAVRVFGSPSDPGSSKWMKELLLEE